MLFRSPVYIATTTLTSSFSTSNRPAIHSSDTFFTQGRPLSLKLRMQLNLIRIARYSVDQHYVKLLIPYNVGAHNVRHLNIDRKSGQERQRVRGCRLAESCTPAWKLLENRLDHRRGPIHVRS